MAFKNTIKPKTSTESSEENATFLFGKTNYKWMLIGAGLILLGFFLMTGHDANTRPDGTFDPTYWNEDIYSFTRIRLAPFLILLGFGIEVYAILLKSNNTK